MYSATFIFKKKQFDAQFHQLDQQIEQVVKSLPGYLGQEAWENTETQQYSNVYYWDSLESLQALVNHPLHLEAKSLQKNWLDGYQVIVSQVLRLYGDAQLVHPLADHGTSKN